MFDNIIFVSPSANTIKDSPLETIDDSQKFTQLNDDVFELVEELSNDGVEDNKNTLLILDDVSSQLRLKENEKQLNQMIKNRRHMNLSIWIVGHKATDLSPSLRSNANMLFLFNAAYKTRFDFLLIDTSLRKSADFLFYRNYNLLEFEDENEK